MKRKFKFIYKVLIIFAVFMGALVFFSTGIKETIFGDEDDTVDMREATLPTILMEVNGNRMNLLHGYASNLDEMLVREAITPIMEDRTFSVIINDYEGNIRKLKYEIFNISGEKAEEGGNTVLDSDTGEKSVRITLAEPLERGKEYVAKITLINSESRRVYFYTRLKYYEDGQIADKLEFARYIHNVLLDSNGQRAKAIEKYLEPAKKGDRTDLSYVNINSPLEMVSYGGLDPDIVYEAVPTFTEFYDEMASVRIDYVLSAVSGSRTEYYSTTEKIRFGFSNNRTYLYNYERNMDAIYSFENYDLGFRSFKLGITGDSDVQTMCSDNRRYMAFVYGGDLIEYDIDTNRSVRVFSFKKNDADYVRDYYDAHEVSLLHLYDNGDADFCVYGYMNRGEYEGRVGIILYRYNFETNAKEERLYIPINSSYQVLFSDMTPFSYVSDTGMFYFSIYDSIYVYNITSGGLETVARDVPAENLIYCESEHYIAWQDSSDDMKAKNIHVLDLETGMTKTISTQEDNIRLFGLINSNIVYGFGRYEDVEKKRDGSSVLPSNILVIANKNCEVLKIYRPESDGLYITGLSIEDNMIVIERVKQKKDDGVHYSEAQSDTILNRHEDDPNPVKQEMHYSDLGLKEYYISVPGTNEILKNPYEILSKNLVINHETTLRVSEPEERQTDYYICSFGNVVNACPNAGQAILAADGSVGTVLDRTGRIIWERGVKQPRSTGAEIEKLRSGSGMTSLQASMKILAGFAGTDVDTSVFDIESDTVGEWLGARVDGLLDMSGATLNEVLYSVYKKQPVLAIRKNGTACIIVAYDTISVTVYEPAKGAETKYSMQEITADFEAAGNLFFGLKP